MATWPDFLKTSLKTLLRHYGRCMAGKEGRFWKRLEAGRPVRRLKC